MGTLGKYIDRLHLAVAVNAAVLLVAMLVGGVISTPPAAFLITHNLMTLGLIAVCNVISLGVLGADADRY